jgi:hypothetical protein
MPEHEVTHGDIHYKMGVLDGKLDALILSVGEKRSDLSQAFTRLSDLEQKMAKWVGVALACSLIIPIVVSAAAPRIHFPGAPPAMVR